MPPKESEIFKERKGFCLISLFACKGKPNRRRQGVHDCQRNCLRYPGRWIDSVWKSRSYADALKENPINLYIFWKLNSYRLWSYLWNLLKGQCLSDTKGNPQKHCFVLLNLFASAHELSERQTSSILAQKYISVLSFEGQNTRAFKRCVCKLLRFLLRRGFCRAELVLCCSTLHLLDLWNIFNNHASRSQKEKISRWNKHVGQQVDLASQCTDCSLPANKWKTEGQNVHSSWL